MPREPNMKLKLLIDAKMEKLTPIKALILTLALPNQSLPFDGVFS